MLREKDIPVWEAARLYLDVRNNDEHTLFSYYWAKILTAFYPESDPEIVLPAILFHDTGWKKIPAEKLFGAFGPDIKFPELTRQHELEGVEIVRHELPELGFSNTQIDAICEIIDGHDTTKHARSLNDSILKDADKLWRFTPHGNRIIKEWFDFSDEDLINKVLGAYVIQGMLTDQGKYQAEIMLETAKINLSLSNYIQHV